MTHKVLVVPPHPSRGLFPAAFLMGVALGMIHLVLTPAFAFLIVALAFSSASTGSAIVVLIVAIITLLTIVPCAIAARMFVRRVQRLRWVPLLGCSFGLGVLLPNMCVALLSQSSELLQRSIQGTTAAGYFGMVLRNSVIQVGACVVTFLCVYGLQRFFGGRIIEQAGRLCWKCAYDIGSPSIARCPECGVDFDSATPPRRSHSRLFDWIIRHARWPARVLIASVVILGCWRFAVAALPSPLSRVLGATSRPALFTSSDTPFNAPITEVFYVGHPTATKRAIAAEFVTDAVTGARCLRLFIGELLRDPSDPNDRISDLQPDICCTLTPSQTASAIDKGVPESLKQALFDMCDRRVQSYRQSGKPPTKPPIIIDPSSHFPAK